MYVIVGIFLLEVQPTIKYRNINENAKKIHGSDRLHYYRTNEILLNFLQDKTCYLRIEIR